MNWLLLVIAASVALAKALPTECVADEHCPSGFYCQTQQHICGECLRCEHFKRAPSPKSVSCVTSVTDCGACLTGSTEDDSGTAIKCEPSNEEVPLGAVHHTPYHWVAIIVALQLVALFICAVTVYALKNFKVYKLRSTTCTTVHADAPMPPPPYNNFDDAPAAFIEETPFAAIKPVTSMRPTDSRESTDIQTARVFNNPNYTRGRQLPSYDTAVLGVEPTINSTNHAADLGVNAVVSERPHVDVAPVMPPPASKITLPRQDSSNNTQGSGDSHSSAAHSSFVTNAASPFIINVIKNINTIHQTESVAP